MWNGKKFDEVLTVVGWKPAVVSAKLVAAGFDFPASDAIIRRWRKHDSYAPSPRMRAQADKLLELAREAAP